jgi:hypothetical protein
LTRKLKPVEIPVQEPFRTAVLAVAVADGGGFTTVGTLVSEAQEALKRANEALADNSLVALAAQDMMKGHRRRGGAAIEVGADGSVRLQITYKKQVSPNATVAPGGAGLPSLAALRAEAETLGLDIEDLGRQKREIIHRIETWKASQSGRIDVALGIVECAEPEAPRSRLRDEVGTSAPLHSKKLPPR